MHGWMDPFAMTSLSRMTFANIPMQLLQCSARTPVHSGTNLSGAACEPKSTRVRPFHPLEKGFASVFCGKALHKRRMYMQSEATAQAP